MNVTALDVNRSALTFVYGAAMDPVIAVGLVVTVPLSLAVGAVAVVRRVRDRGKTPLSEREIEMHTWRGALILSAGLVFLALPCAVGFVLSARSAGRHYSATLPWMILGVFGAFLPVTMSVAAVMLELTSRTSTSPLKSLLFIAPLVAWVVAVPFMSFASGRAIRN